MKWLDTPYFTSVSFIPPCSSIEHFWQPIDHDYPAFIATFETIPELSLIHHFSHQLVRIPHAFMPYITTLHLHLCNQSFTPLIGIHPLHNYKVHKIFPMPIHSCYLAFNIPCSLHIGCITIINIINMYMHDTFLHSNIHMV